MPVEGTLEEDQKVYTFANYLDYPFRKLVVFTALCIFGMFNASFPLVSTLTLPVLGVAGVYNDLY